MGSQCGGIREVRESASSISTLEIGTFVKLPLIETVELMALAGFDHVVVDLEHSPMSMESAATLISAARLTGTTPLVRIPSHGYEWIQRCLDAGAHGVLVPHVDDGSQAQALTRAGRFPPQGIRGMGPTSRAGHWGLRPVLDYVTEGEDRMIIMQIESAAAVANVEEILDAGPTALFLGPADLGLEMGVPSDHPLLLEAQRTVLAACHSRGVACGIATGTPEAAKRLSEQGYDFLVIGNDATMLGKAAHEVIRATRGAPVA